MIEIRINQWTTNLTKYCLFSRKEFNQISGASTSTEEETGGDSDPEMSRFLTVSIGLTMLCTTNHTGTCTV